MNDKGQSSNLPQEWDRLDPQLVEQLVSEFLNEFSSEADCLKELYRLVGIDDSHCSYCGSSNIDKSDSERTAVCLNCKQISWFTSGTVLQNLKKARPRLAVIWLSIRGVYLSSERLSRLLDIAQSTAHNIKMWLNSVLEAALPIEADCYRPTLFKAVITKRSRQTPALEHPSAEMKDENEERQLTSDLETTGRNDADAITGARSDLRMYQFGENGSPPGSTSVSPNSEFSDSSIDPANEARLAVLHNISSEPIHLEHLIALVNLPIGGLLAAVTALELSGEVRRQFGSWYVRCSPEIHKETPLSPDTQAVIESFVRFVKQTYHGVSRKFLQGYIADFWYQRNRQFQFMEDIFMKTRRNNALHSLRNSNKTGQPLPLNLVKLPA